MQSSSGRVSGLCSGGLKTSGNEEPAGTNGRAAPGLLRSKNLTGGKNE
jgi:hypothetical protein